MASNNYLVFDGGNSLVKFASASAEGFFPHALTEISETKYRHAQRLFRDNPSPDFIRVNGKYYVVGESAEEYGITTRQQNQSRYKKEYFGVLLASAIARTYKKVRELRVFASHPPGHVEYVDLLMDSLFGEYDIECGGNQLNVDVVYCNIFDEPTGGFMNVALNEEGTSYSSTAFKGKRFLVFDIGGGTTDYVVIKEDGSVDYTNATSETTGINEALHSFRQAFLHRYKAHFSDTDRIHPARLRQAFATGSFIGGGREFDCAEEAERARTTLINMILRSFISLGGGMNFDGLLFTGGGSGLIIDHIRPQLNNNNVVLAEKPEEIHMANVYGGRKLWKLYNQIGV